MMRDGIENLRNGKVRHLNDKEFAELKARVRKYLNSRRQGIDIRL
jgi:hypothetical protein